MDQKTLSGSEKLTMKDKIGFLMVNLGPGACGGFVNSYRLIYFTDALGVDPVSLGSLSIISSLAAIVAAPIIGMKLDNAKRNRFGHYKLPLIISAILYAVFFAAMWFIPFFVPDGAKSAAILITSVLMVISNSMYDNASYSILPTLSTDVKDRVTLSSLKGSVASFAIYGISFVAPLFIGASTEASGYMIVAVIIIILMALAAAGAGMLRERVEAPKHEKVSFKEMIGVLKYRPVFMFFLAHLIQTMGTCFVLMLSAYYFTYVVENLQIYSLVSIIQTFAMLPMLMVLGKFVEKFGRKKMYLVGMLGMVWFPLFRIVNVKSIPILVVTAVLYGLSQGAMASSKTGIMADACDYVFITTGRQQNGAVSSLFSVASNIITLVGTSLPMYIFAMCGFVSGASEQTDGVIRAIIALVLIVPVVLSSVLAVIFAKFYPIGKEEAQAQGEKIRSMQDK
ncbi:MAG: MFS transporter [Eubacteriales bacterium]|nr:MFS transporter [Eubacteriales bacterium]